MSHAKKQKKEGATTQLVIKKLYFQYSHYRIYLRGTSNIEYIYSESVHIIACNFIVKYDSIPFSRGYIEDENEMYIDNTFNESKSTF